MFDMFGLTRMRQVQVAKPVSWTAIIMLVRFNVDHRLC